MPISLAAEIISGETELYYMILGSWGEMKVAGHGWILAKFFPLWSHKKGAPNLRGEIIYLLKPQITGKQIIL